MDGDTFNKTELFEAIQANNVTLFHKLCDNERKGHSFRRLSSTGETYLHLAIQKNCDLAIVKGLIRRVHLGQRNINCKTAFELALEKKNADSAAIAKLHQDFILDCIKNGEVAKLKELAMDGWSFWPVKGIPEIETFPEAPMYLNQGIMGATLNSDMYIFTKKQLKEVAQLEIKKKQMQDVAKQRDPLGLTLLHKAVLFRDFQSVSALLKHEEVATLLALQDNMGRTPLHYASCFTEHNEIRISLEDMVKSLSSNILTSIVDKTGHSVLDYTEKKAKIDTKKVYNLSVALGKVSHLEKLFVDLFIDKSVDVEDEPTIPQLIKNCDDGALLDVTGRNVLHKCVIFGSHYAITAAKELLTLDKENVLFRGQDLWGRTPMHYAYMLNHTEAIQLLNTKRAYLTLDIINEVKQIKDAEGRTINDFHLEEEDANALAENLQQSMKLLYQIRPIMQVQQKVLQSVLLETQKRKPLHEEPDSTWDSDDSDDDSVVGLSKYRDEHDFEEDLAVLEAINNNTEDEGLQLLLGMKDFTGSTLAHYAVSLNHEKLQEMLTDSTNPEILIKTIRDNLGRTPLHLISLLPKNSDFREFLESILEEHNDNSDDSDDSSDGGDSYDMENDASDEEEETENSKHNKKKEADDKKPILADLAGKIPEDYVNNPVDHLQKEDFLQFLRTGLENAKVGTLVKQQNISSKTLGVEIQVNGSNAKPSPSVKPPRFSATNRVSHPPVSQLAAENTTPFDSEYLKRELGVTLTSALADISLCHPADPIEYLAHYLYKHAENLQRKEQELKDAEQLKLEEKAAEKEEMMREIARQEKLALRKQQMGEAAARMNEKTDVIKEEMEEA